MARGRLVSKTLGGSRKFAALALDANGLGEFAQVLFPLLIPQTDDWGRCSGDAWSVKMAAFPSSPRSVEDFDAALGAMHRAGLITRYLTGGDWFLQIANFDREQPGLRLDRRVKSRFPDPPAHDSSTPCLEFPVSAGQCQAVPGNAGLREGKGREEKVRTSDGAKAPPTPFRQVSGIVRGILEEKGLAFTDDADLEEEAKRRCAQRGVPYDSSLIGRALDSERFKRARGIRRHAPKVAS